MLSFPWPDWVQIPSEQANLPREPPGVMGSLLTVLADVDSSRAVWGCIQVKSTNVLLTFSTYSSPRQSAAF